MASVLWETDDSFATMFIIWSGAATPWRTYLYADYQYVYISQAPSITRLKYGMGSGVSMEARDVTDVMPAGSGNLVPYVMTHHLNLWGDYFYTVALEAPIVETASGGRVHHSYYPETTDSWESYDQTFGRVVDVEFPNYLEDLRVCVGVSTSGFVRVLPVSPSGVWLDGSYWTDWSAMDNSAVVTDLEARWMY
ncbi:MAG: hypothetical protein ACXABD_15255 [Candidatus Thorarchaeota archaeon]|jgi:hypothetical protein